MSRVQERRFKATILPPPRRSRDELTREIPLVKITKEPALAWRVTVLDAVLFLGVAFIWGAAVAAFVAGAQ